MGLSWQTGGRYGGRSGSVTAARTRLTWRAPSRDCPPLGRRASRAARASHPSAGFSLQRVPWEYPSSRAAPPSPYHHPRRRNFLPLWWPPRHGVGRVPAVVVGSRPADTFAERNRPGQRRVNLREAPAACRSGTRCHHRRPLPHPRRPPPTPRATHAHSHERGQESKIPRPRHPLHLYTPLPPWETVPCHLSANRSFHSDNCRLYYLIDNRLPQPGWRFVNIAKSFGFGCVYRVRERRGIGRTDRFPIETELVYFFGFWFRTMGDLVAKMRVFFNFLGMAGLTVCSIRHSD